MSSRFTSPAVRNQSDAALALGKFSTLGLQLGELASPGLEGAHLVVFGRSAILGRSHESAGSEAESWLRSADNRSRYFIVSELDWSSESGDPATSGLVPERASLPPSPREAFSGCARSAVPTQVVELSFGTEEDASS